MKVIDYCHLLVWTVISSQAGAKNTCWLAIGCSLCGVFMHNFLAKTQGRQVMQQGAFITASSLKSVCCVNWRKGASLALSNAQKTAAGCWFIFYALEFVAEVLALKTFFFFSCTLEVAEDELEICTGLQLNWQLWKGYQSCYLTQVKKHIYPNTHVYPYILHTNTNICLGRCGFGHGAVIYQLKVVG